MEVKGHRKRGGTLKKLTAAAQPHTLYFALTWLTHEP
jgi:hypothetical protein